MMKGGRYIKKILLVAAHMLLLPVLTYLAWNIPYDVTGASGMLRRYHLVSSAVGHEYDKAQDELLLVNVSYDKVLVEKKDSTTDEVKGNIDITDRGKLLRLMEALKREGNYKYVVCDVQVFNEFKTEHDSALYATLSSMPRVVVPLTCSRKELPRELQGVAYNSQYDVIYDNTSFLKYQILRDNAQTLPLKMACELDSVRYRSYCNGLIYTMNGHLCVNAPIADIVVNYRNYVDDDGVVVINDLGNDILPVLDMGVEGLFKDRIVIIGDCMENDMHDTVAGTVSGPIILYNVYRMLVEGKNIVSEWVLVIIAFLYAFMTMAVLKCWTLGGLIRKLWKRMPVLLEWIFDWVGLEAVLYVVCLLLYVNSNVYIEIWVIGLYFLLLGKIHELKRLKSGIN